jgi:phosphoglycerate dehydrogenase-like enzyme
MKVAILDDYQQVALAYADWSAMPDGTDILAFRDHAAGLEELKRRLKGYGVVVAMRERTAFSPASFGELRDLRLLVTTGMRNASIDLASATRAGVTVCGTRGGGPSTAELAWGLILSLLRQIPQEYESVRQGGWQTSVGTDLQGKTLGLLGLGNLGSHMATIGRAFGMRVIAWSQNLTAERAHEYGAVVVSKDELFAQSDIISIHLQLSDRTRGLVSARELAMMKPTSYLINTSRGPIVNEDALVDAVRSHRIAGAGIDVYDPEPLAPDHRLRSLENVITTPHLGYVTSETYKIFYGDAVEDILAWSRGKPLRVLNPEVLSKSR